MEKDFIDAMTLFNEKTEKLINSRFVQHLKEKGMNVNLKIDEAGGALRSNLPDQESIDAFILNLRYFIQDNEISSLRNLTDQYNQSNISDELKKEFNFARDKLNEELDKVSTVKIDKNLRNRDIFETFIYGGIAHANPDKRKIFDAWLNNKYVYNFLQIHFYNILFYILNVIAYIANINKKTMSVS